MRSIFQAQGALKELARLLPDKAEKILKEDETETIPLEQLQEGDFVLVRPVLPFRQTAL